MFYSFISFSPILSLLGANSRPSPCMSMTITEPQSASCDLASAKLTGWLHEKKASFRNSTHCTVWTQQLLSAKDKHTNRERRWGREKREERGRHENMQGSERAKCKPMKNAAVSGFVCVALMTCMKLECHKMLYMVIISCSHTRSHT